MGRWVARGKIGCRRLDDVGSVDLDYLLYLSPLLQKDTVRDYLRADRDRGRRGRPEARTPAVTVGLETTEKARRTLRCDQ